MSPFYQVILAMTAFVGTHFLMCNQSVNPE